MTRQEVLGLNWVQSCLSSKGKIIFYLGVLRHISTETFLESRLRSRPGREIYFYLFSFKFLLVFFGFVLGVFYPGKQFSWELAAVEKRTGSKPLFSRPRVFILVAAEREGEKKKNNQPRNAELAAPGWNALTVPMLQHQ